MPNGEGEQYNYDIENGNKLEYVGYFIDGKFHGDGIYYYEDGITI